MLIAAPALLLAKREGVAQRVNKLADDLKNGEFNWFPERSQGGPVIIIVSIPDQLVHVYRNGVRIAASTCSTGKPGHRTPTGVFQILQKDKHHRSSTYSNAPSPRSIPRDNGLMTRYYHFLICPAASPRYSEWPVSRQAFPCGWRRWHGAVLLHPSAERRPRQARPANACPCRALPIATCTSMALPVMLLTQGGPWPLRSWHGAPTPSSESRHWPPSATSQGVSFIGHGRKTRRCPALRWHWMTMTRPA